jgi:hypothetical protein
MATFLDVYQRSLNKHGEELCGDQTRVYKSPYKTTIVLSDGLGSGVKANILATLTSEIIMTMVREGVELKEILQTVIRTLPIDRVQRIAYATFTILSIDQETLDFNLVNFDNPAPFVVNSAKIALLATTSQKILGKQITTSQGKLAPGDFIGLCSDGILYAGPTQILNYAWAWDDVAAHIQALYERPIYFAHSLVNDVVATTAQLYGQYVWDDATFVGVYARHRRDLMVFTGPPIDNGFDYVYVDRLLDFAGRKVVCGGTTANIVGAYLGKEVETLLGSMDDDVPAIGRLPKIDLVTEGVLTLAAALELVEKSAGKIENLKPSKNGAYLLASEFLNADAIQFLVGQSVNPAFHNPLLPKNVSIRRYLIEHIADALMSLNKDVKVEYC